MHVVLMFRLYMWNGYASPITMHIIDLYIYCFCVTNLYVYISSVGMFKFPLHTRSNSCVHFQCLFCTKHNVQVPMHCTQEVTHVCTFNVCFVLTYIITGSHNQQ